MKTQALEPALDTHGFDAAIGGARRDEEKSRAKERVFSFHSARHHWDPKDQRPELWSLHNARKHKGGVSPRAPLSNCAELDVWESIHLEQIPIVPPYFALARAETPRLRTVRFRTLGCDLLTGALESEATTVPAIIRELLSARMSERQGRVNDATRMARWSRRSGTATSEARRRR